MDLNWGLDWDYWGGSANTIIRTGYRRSLSPHRCGWVSSALGGGGHANLSPAVQQSLPCPALPCTRELRTSSTTQRFDPRNFPPVSGRLHSVQRSKIPDSSKIPLLPQSTPLHTTPTTHPPLTHTLPITRYSLHSTPSSIYLRILGPSRLLLIQVSVSIHRPHLAFPF